MDHVLVDGERFAFDEDVWVEEVHRFRERGASRAAAISARRRSNDPGARMQGAPAGRCVAYGLLDGLRLELLCFDLS